MITTERELLTSLQSITTNESAPPVDHIDHDRWVLGSLLQKAIRRDEPRWALRAAATLLIAESRWFWRRLVVIAMEDISFGDLRLCADVMVAAKHRKAFYDDWALAAHLIKRMCSAFKCRALNDLVELGEFREDSRQTMQAYQTLTFDDLQFVLGNPVERPWSRYLAGLMVAFEYRDGLKHPELDCARYLSGLAELKLPACVHFIVRAALKDWRLEHAVALPVLFQTYEGLRPIKTVDDVFPAVDILQDIPSYAFDMHTRIGSSAIRRFLSQSRVVQDCFHAAGIDQRLWPSLLRHCMFELEAGLLAHRLSDPVFEFLRTQAEQIGFGRTHKNHLLIKQAIETCWDDYVALRTWAVKQANP